MANKTIEEKLISLIQIRERLKSKIEEKGVIVPQNTPFKNYYSFIDQIAELDPLPEDELKTIYDLMWYCTSEKLCENAEEETAEINEYFNKIIGG